jgi:hypothetical protein
VTTITVNFLLAFATSAHTQARVSLPAGTATMSATSPKTLVLELWAAGSLLCSYSSPLLPSSCSPVLEELAGWAAGLAGTEQEGSADGRASHPEYDLEGVAFVRDLRSWMRFQGSSIPIQEMHQHQQQQRGQVAEDGGAFEEQYEDQLALMVDVGRDLLFYSVRCGMVALSGKKEAFKSLP